MEINKLELLKFLNEIDLHNIHVDCENELRPKLRDKLHDYIDCLEKHCAEENNETSDSGLNIDSVVFSEAEVCAHFETDGCGVKTTDACQYCGDYEKKQT